MNKSIRIPATFTGIMCAVMTSRILNAPAWTNKHQKQRLQHKLEAISDSIELGMLAQKQNSDTVLINAEGRKELLSAYQKAFNAVHFPKNGRDYDQLMKKSPAFASIAKLIVGDNVVPLSHGAVHREPLAAGDRIQRAGTGH